MPIERPIADFNTGLLNAIMIGQRIKETAYQKEQQQKQEERQARMDEVSTQERQAVAQQRQLDNDYRRRQEMRGEVGTTLELMNAGARPVQDGGFVRDAVSLPQLTGGADQPYQEATDLTGSPIMTAMQNGARPAESGRTVAMPFSGASFELPTLADQMSQQHTVQRNATLGKAQSESEANSMFGQSLPPAIQKILGVGEDYKVPVGQVDETGRMATELQQTVNPQPKAPPALHFAQVTEGGKNFLVAMDPTTGKEVKRYGDGSKPVSQADIREAKEDQEKATVRNALAQTVIDNPSLFDQLTPTEKGNIAPELASKGFTGFGKPLSDGAITKMSESRSAIDSLRDLKKTLQENEQYIGPLAGFQALNPYSEGRKAQAKIDLVKQRVGKALEGGVLRKEDEDKYKKILATLNDTPETAMAKVDGIIATLEKDLSNYIDEQRRGGRKVTEPPKGGKVLKFDPATGTVK